VTGEAVDIVGFGEAMVLFQPTDGAPLDSCTAASVHVAGAELNLCAAAAHVGARTAFCSRVGDDPFGRRVLAAARALGIGTDLVAVDQDRPTGVFFKDVRPDGARRVHYYRRGSAASALGRADATRALAAGPRVVAVSGLTAALGTGPRDAVVELARAAHAAGVAVALDPNLRPGLPPVLDVVDTLLRYTTYLFLGADEAGPVLGADAPQEVYRAARARGVAEVLLKAGAGGCWYPVGGRMRHQPALATSVVDPVGAGDALAGGYLAARLAGVGTAGAAALGSRLAAAVVASPGDTDGLRSVPAGSALLDP
jgi:2-dehydro-3-deoxygluconokinase